MIHHQQTFDYLEPWYAMLLSRSPHDDLNASITELLQLEVVTDTVSRLRLEHLLTEIRDALLQRNLELRGIDRNDNGYIGERAGRTIARAERLAERIISLLAVLVSTSRRDIEVVLAPLLIDLELYADAEGALEQVCSSRPGYLM